MSAENILEVRSEEERRHLSRRSSDLSLSEKAKCFDSLILNATFDFDRWAKLAHAAGSNGSKSYYEGQAHSYAAILFYADIKVVCPCGSCTEGRISTNEDILRSLTEAEACAKTAEEA